MVTEGREIVAEEVEGVETTVSVFWFCGERDGGGEFFVPFDDDKNEERKIARREKILKQATCRVRVVCPFLNKNRNL